MHRRFLASLVLVCSVFIFQAGAVISGKIIKSNGDPIAGAAVILMGKNLVDTTDASGEYSITVDETAVWQCAALDGINPSVAILNGALNFFINKPSQVNVRVFDLRGKLLMSIQNRHFDIGRHSIMLDNRSNRGQALVVKASIAGNSFELLYRPLTKSVRTMKWSRDESLPLAKKAAAVDSLKILSPGFIPKRSPVESFSQTLNVTLAGLDQGVWKILADIPVPQIGCAASVLNGQLHVIGGAKVDGTGATTDHQVYDPETNTWTQKKALPAKSGWPGTAVYKGKLYVFGGDNQAWDVSETDKLWIYDPATDSWTAGKPMLKPRSYLAAITVGKYIYLCGSRTLMSDEADHTTYRYDPEADTYEQLADMPEGARYITIGYWDGNIYVVHGETDKEVMADQGMKYNIASNTWSKLTAIRPEKTKWTMTQNSSDISIGPLLFHLGGKPPDGPRSEVCVIFDMSKEIFLEGTKLPEGRCCGAAGAIENRIYMAGGFWEWSYPDVKLAVPLWAYPFEAN